MLAELMYRIIGEGDIELKVYKESLERISKSARVFFNPGMKLNRDITVAIARAIGGIKFLDLLGATGAKGLRIAKEVGAKVAINDVNPKAVELIRENASLNELDVEVCRREANLLLYERELEFNFIDIDPFGSPVPFMDSTLRSVSSGGVVALTATDMPPLCGIYPGTAWRRYLAMPLRGELCKEAGLRILVGYAARIAASHNRAATPILVHSSQHYFRCFMRVERGAKKADGCLGNMGYLHFCPNCRTYEVEHASFPEPKSCCGRKMELSGPMWLGEIKEVSTVEAALEKSPSIEAEKLLDTIAREADIPFYYDIHRLASRLGLPALPPMKKIVGDVEKRGYKATRTHIQPTALKTDLPIKEFSSIIKSL